jgi:hypothetical protein
MTTARAAHWEANESSLTASRMNRALLIGIDDYDNYSKLDGCVADVRALEPLLARHDDKKKNFACVAYRNDVSRRQLKNGVKELLAPGADVALFYFAGHGASQESDVILVTKEGDRSEPGLALSEILAEVVRSKVREVIIILDCCFSGGAGGLPQLGGDVAAIRSGLSLLTASRSDQTAAERDSRGLFSTYLCGALQGGAADVLGKVTVAGVYAYVTECLGSWAQRPMLKANVDRLHVLRNCTPAVSEDKLRRLHALFPRADDPLPLDPSYEPTVEPHDEEHEADFAILQSARAAKLVEPVGAEHMYYAAMNSKACRLTPLGRLYWTMVEQDDL